MAKIGNMSLITLFVMGIAFISQKACAHKPANAGKDAAFSYADPSKWGDIDPKYKLCSTGSKQSPIDIDMGKAVETNYVPYNVTYKITSASLISTGLGISLAVKGKNEVTIDKRVYRLVDIRWHTPSEHVFNGKAFDLEMQQVFEANDKTGNVAIISSFYKGSPNGASRALISPIEDNLKELAKIFDPKSKATMAQDVEAVKLDQITQFLTAPTPKGYLRYSGSLTTPPCTEEVVWILHPQELPVLNDQLDSVRALLSADNKKNARPVQKLNGREVLSVSKNAPAN